MHHAGENESNQWTQAIVTAPLSPSFIIGHIHLTRLLAASSHTQVIPDQETKAKSS